MLKSSSLETLGNLQINEGYRVSVGLRARAIDLAREEKFQFDCDASSHYVLLIISRCLILFLSFVAQITSLPPPSSEQYNTSIHRNIKLHYTFCHAHSIINSILSLFFLQFLLLSVLSHSSQILFTNVFFCSSSFFRFSKISSLIYNSFSSVLEIRRKQVIFEMSQIDTEPVIADKK